MTKTRHTFRNDLEKQNNKLVHKNMKESSPKEVLEQGLREIRKNPKPKQVERKLTRKERSQLEGMSHSHDENNRDAARQFDKVEGRKWLDHIKEQTLEKAAKLKHKIDHWRKW